MDTINTIDNARLLDFIFILRGTNKFITKLFLSKKPNFPLHQMEMIVKFQAKATITDDFNQSKTNENSCSDHGLL